ncbi:MAG: CZB domain-containing protein [Pseudomonadales bacterium]
MDIYDEIEKAISAHGQWKVKLRRAIDTGVCESTPDKVKQDNNCSFGKWLHYRLDEQYKDCEMYRDVVNLHANFHREAGTILELALNGEREQAQDLIKLGGRFSRYSGQLTRTMKQWQASLAQR